MQAPMSCKGECFPTVAIYMYVNPGMEEGTDDFFTVIEHNAETCLPGFKKQFQKFFVSQRDMIIGNGLLKGFFSRQIRVSEHNPKITGNQEPEGAAVGMDEGKTFPIVPVGADESEVILFFLLFLGGSTYICRQCARRREINAVFYIFEISFRKSKIIPVMDEKGIILWPMFDMLFHPCRVVEYHIIFGPMN